jgi:hypothetical protein
VSNNLLPVLGIAAIGAGVAFVASKAYGSSDDAGTTPPDAPGPVFDVTASSGAVYQVQHVKTFDTESGKQSFWDVFDIQGRVLRYSQLENDANSRVFIVSPRGPNGPGVDLVMRDFGIRFEGGPISDPIPEAVLVNNPDSIKVLPGQVLVSPGVWMATADVGFPQNLVVSAGLIKAALEEQGWRQVSVYTDAPPSWPLSKNGNYFVEAVWNQEAQIMSVPPQVVDMRSNSLV